MIYSKWIIKETKTGFEMELDESDKTERKEQKEFYPIATMGGFMIYFPRHGVLGKEYYKQVLIDFAVKEIQGKINFLENIKTNLLKLEK